MPHPIYGPPEHELETITVTYHLPSLRNGLEARVEVLGTSSTKRGYLWTYRESWRPGEQRADLEPTDVIHWAVLAAAQDRVASQEAFNRATSPQGWQDVQLPF